MKEINDLLNQMLETLNAKDEADQQEIENKKALIKQSEKEIQDRKSELEARKSERVQFQKLLEIITKLGQNNTESLAKLYISKREHEDFEEFAESTGISLCENEQEGEKAT